MRQGAVGVALLVALARAATAEGRPVLTTAVEAGSAFPSDSAATFVLTAAAGDQDEAFSIELRPTLFVSRAQGADRYEGATLAPAAVPVVEGAGSIAHTGGAIGDPAGCVHGTAARWNSWEVRVPAGATTTFRFPYKAASTRPWQSTRYTLTALVRPSGALPAAPVDETFTWPAVPVTPSSLVREIRLATTPRTDAVPMLARPRSVRAGRRLVIRGMTAPPLRHGHVRLSLRAIRPRERPTWVTLLRTDGRGRFETPWRVPSRGRYEVWADVPTEPGAFSCPLGVVAR